MKNKKINRQSNSFAPSKNESTIDKLINSSVLGLAITAGISLAIILIATAIAISLADPLALVDPIGYISLFVSAFFGGFTCSKINKFSPYITSVLCGCAFIILSLLISVAIPHTLASGMNIWSRIGLHALSLATFPIGAFAGIKGAKKSKPNKKKRR